MKKEYTLTAVISFLTLLSVAIILFMLMLPQQVQVLEGNVNKYDAITKSKYTFSSTKDVTSEALKKQYSINDEDMSKFRANSQYVAGNSDPFTPAESSETNTENKGNSTTNNSSNTTNLDKETEQKTTNSNGGVKNPASTGK